MKEKKNKNLWKVCLNVMVLGKVGNQNEKMIIV
jgi:hypothetical protein